MPRHRAESPVAVRENRWRVPSNTFSEGQISGDRQDRMASIRASASARLIMFTLRQATRCSLSVCCRPVFDLSIKGIIYLPHKVVQADNVLALDWATIPLAQKHPGLRAWSIEGPRVWLDSISTSRLLLYPCHSYCTLRHSQDYCLGTLEAPKAKTREAQDGMD